MTTDPQPQDIDLVSIIETNHVDRLSDADYAQMAHLNQREYARSEYGLDLYHARAGDAERLSYYDTLFTFYADRLTQKGYAAVELSR